MAKISFLDNLITKFISKPFENWLLKKLLNGSGLEKKDVDQEKRKINLGLWAIGIYFLDPKHQLSLYFLTKLYGYKCYQLELRFNATWCDGADKVNENFLEFESSRKVEFDKRMEIKNQKS